MDGFRLPLIGYSKQIADNPFDSLITPKFMKKITLVFLALFWACLSSNADVRLPNVLNSNMVLQRDMPVPIWGWADEGEKVTVSFAGQKKSATVGKNGEWMVKLHRL